ncbi:MAG: HAD family phosphatase [Bacteroidota bacterium]
MDLSAIRNIIFDLGGVIIDLDVQATFAGFASVNRNLDASKLSLDEVGLLLDYEKGLISSEAFRAGIHEVLENPSLTDEKIDKVWNSMLLSIPEERLALIQRLAQNYRLFVLSNTNEIHVTAFNQIVEQVSGQPTIDAFFEKVYFSHEVKMRKPEQQIYEHVLEDSQLKPEETLFLDDKQENLLAAQKVGIDTIQVTPRQDILSIFANL